MSSQAGADCAKRAEQTDTATAAQRRLVGLASRPFRSLPVKAQSWSSSVELQAEPTTRSPSGDFGEDASIA